MQAYLIDELRLQLRAVADPERAAGEKRYLKSNDVFLGVTVPSGQRLAKEFRKTHPDLPFDQVRDIARALWVSTVHEEKRLAVQILDLYQASLTPQDWPMLGHWIRQSGSWDLVDEIAAHLLGHLAGEHPELEADLDYWVSDECFWIRRAVLVSYVPRIRRGIIEPQVVRDRCDTLMLDGEYFVRKALGWLLRECAVRDPQGTIPFLKRWAGTMPRPVLREAVRKLDHETQSQLLSRTSS